MFIPEIIIQGFIITLISEFLIIFFFLRKSFFKTLLIIVSVHFITHPTAMFLFYLSGSGFWIAESVIWIIESILYSILFKIDIKKAFLIALIANAVSVFVGYALRSFFI